MAESSFPYYRPRRLRKSAALRALVAETALRPDAFIYPIFAVEGKGIVQPVEAMPGIDRFSPDKLAPIVAEASKAGVPALLIFGIPAEKDEAGSGAYAEDGIVPQAIKAVKRENKDMLVVTDVCMCEYTSHGHCGVVKDGDVDNDATLPLLAKTALAQVRAGADIVAPSDMMDGRVAVIRAALDDAGFVDAPIMAYSAKYASAFYGPFREAAESAPAFGDRRSYQMDFRNSREAAKEAALDEVEGADIVMVKPALAYLDVIAAVRAQTDLPVAAYNVSGEYAMVKAAAQAGWIDERAAVTEILTAIKRAGADIIITYHALEFAKQR
jgi:porphobilinogen synthase